MAQISLLAADALSQKIIEEAEESVTVVANINSSLAHTAMGFVRQPSLRIVNPNRNLRFAVGVGGPVQQTILEQLFFHEHVVQASEWDLRTSPPLPIGESFVIVDGRIAVVSRPGGRHGAGLYFRVDDEEGLEKVAARIEAIWDQGVDVKLLYSDSEALLAKEHADLVRVSKHQWDHIIKALQRRPDRLWSVDPTVFEHLIAELLDRDGMQVQVTQRSADGGKDILAWMDTPVGRHLYFVECKRYARTHRVGVELVRQLYGTVTAARATAGLFVTTSSFTGPALAFSKTVENHMSLRDYDGLVTWLGKQGKNGSR